MTEKIETKELAVIKGQLSKAESKVNDIVIKSNDDYVEAIDILGRMKELGKMIKNRKEAITKPMNDALRSARDLFRPLEDQFESNQRTIEGKLLTYKRKVDDEARAKEAELAKKVETGKITVEAAAKKMDKVERVEATVQGNKGATFQVRKVKDVEVIDRDLIPDEYYQLDMVSVRRDALAGKEIPGVRVFEKEVAATVTSR